MPHFAAGLLLLVAMSHAAGAAGADACPEGQREIRARDAESGDALAEVIVQLRAGADAGADVGMAAVAGRTDAHGLLCAAAADGGTLLARRLGYASLRVTVPAGSAPVELRLVPVALELEAVVQVAAAGAPVRTVETSFGGVALALTPAVRRAIPALAGPDALRTLSLVAPVAARSDFAPGLSIYGSSPDQTRLELEGVPLLSAQHLGGVFPAIAEEALGAVSPSPASARAGAGGALGGRVRMELRTDTTAGWTADVDLGLLMSGGTARMISRGGRAALTVSARMSTIDQLAAQLHDEGFPYRFSDALGAARLQLPGDGALTLLAVAGRDALRLGELPSVAGGQRPVFTDTTGKVVASLERPVGVRADWSTTALGARLVQPVGRVYLDGRVSRTATTGGVRLAEGSLDVSNAVSLTTAAATASLPLAVPAGDARLEAGGSVTRANVDYGLTLLTVPAPIAPVQVASRAAWGEAEVPLTRSLRVRAGVRHERVPQAGWRGTLPTLGVTWQDAARPLRLDLTAGRSAQWLHSATPDGMLAAPVEFWMASGAALPVAVGEELVAAAMPGDEKDGRMLRLTGWLRAGHALPSRPPAITPFGADYLMRTVDARAAGVDVRAVAHRSAAAQLIVGYTLASSTRSDGVATWPALDDRRHLVTALGILRPRPATTVSAALTWHTGVPTTEQVGAYYTREPNPFSGGWFLGDAQPVYGTYHGMRLPAYGRLDVQVTRVLASTRDRVEVTAGVLNLLNRHNPLQYEWRYLAPPATRSLRGQLPILPILGVTGRF